MANLPHYLYLRLGERRIHLWERLIRRALAISDHRGPATPCAALSSRIEDELRRISLYLPPPSQLVARLSSSEVSRLGFCLRESDVGKKLFRLNFDWKAITKTIGANFIDKQEGNFETKFQQEASPA
ncbi:hypothetical protein OsI_33356 [Oryza sativa Indica Group]|uniref:Uncharacterized protein n=1 Tax=Oryza sativa subsp. indica TaxID=39946 RepID=B8BGL1_ORYSI|nr:hypothetical protein OsI_33356 [Oryza sativa Indica Group]